MSKLRYNEVKGREREFLALTSLTVDEFERLVVPFEVAFQAHMSKWRLDGKPRTKRSYTTYQNCPLPTAEDRLLFVLSYVKGNPLQSHHGLQFGMAQGKTNTWLHTLLPALRETFRRLAVAPSRSVQELAERLDVALREAGLNPTDPETPLPLFVTTAQNDALSAPKMALRRSLAIAVRKKLIP
jgi:hypothetical protein